MPIPKRDRDKDAKRAKEEFKKADHDGVSVDQILAEDQQVEQFGLPTTWSQGDSPLHIRGKDTIVAPDDQQTALAAT